MPPPTHSPHCRTVCCYPRACPDCRQEVYYWSCTCGSYVLFDQLGEPWPKHECATNKRLLPLRPTPIGGRSRPFDETNPMLFVRCELCGEKVRQGRVEEHERRVHRRGKKAVAVPANFDDCYDEESLRQRLGQSLGVRVSIERRGDWGLSAVPTIRADGPWSDYRRDVYWRAFARFCRWPTWKESARLEVYDPDPTLDRWDARRLTLFYRSDLRRLSIASKTQNHPQTHNAIIEGVPLRELCNLRTYAEVLKMPERPRKPPRGQT